ncbi:cobalamin-independent methionine synthase II family protein [Mycobacterium sp. SM1]|uniref:cobalamin-independent methionine synthase II family protein n=1 Tax=Mycobacterium sp. SM1 TaxID=2816243 RepID=UPI001BD07F54|nr:cobalamin-independent methionine synthase II family protein [Mycobacterium sp. SM1]MBS4728722.1 cobalamin-independent methionine synthase II family protein [Mycobacterium sp. SM1]
MRVGSQDILLPTTMVGNYPNPRWYDGQAFARYPVGEFVYDAISREALEDAVGAIVHDQEAAGIDVISDGKVYGGDSPYGQILYHYVERMSGYKLSGPPIGLPIYSTLFAPTCVGEVRREHPFHLATLRATRKATKKPVKISYTGLGVLAAATSNQYYKDTKELALALARAFNEDFKELADNGCDIIQLDEFVWPYGMGDWEIEALNKAVEGVGTQFWVHTCWGNYSGTPAYLPDDEEKEFGAWILDRRPASAPAPERARAIFPQVLDAQIDALNYEVGRMGPDDLKPLLDHGWPKDFVAGVIDVKSTITETADEVADRIRQVLEFVPAERLGLSTDCGLINLPRMVAASKLRALADGAAIVRKTLTSG